MWLLPGAGSCHCHCHCCDTSGRRCCFSLVSGVKGTLGAVLAAGSSSRPCLGCVSPSLTKAWAIWSHPWPWLTRNCPLPVWQTGSLVPGQH